MRREGDASKTEKVVARDPPTIAGSIRLLKTRSRPGVWYVLEGKSAPDVFFESTKALVVIEGKRTERKALSQTSWMPKRSQMLRHLDAAWEIRDAKRVLRLMTRYNCASLMERHDEFSAEVKEAN